MAKTTKKTNKNKRRSFKQAWAGNVIDKDKGKPKNGTRAKNCIISFAFWVGFYDFMMSPAWVPTSLF